MTDIMCGPEEEMEMEDLIQIQDVDDDCQLIEDDEDDDCYIVEEPTTKTQKSVIPITFFNSSRNIMLLSKCQQLSIQLVDCKKYPWHCKQVTKSEDHLPVNGTKLRSDENEKIIDVDDDCQSIKSILSTNEMVCIVDDKNSNHDKMNSRLAKDNSDKCKQEQANLKKNIGLVGIKVIASPQTVKKFESVGVVKEKCVSTKNKSKDLKSDEEITKEKEKNQDRIHKEIASRVCLPEYKKSNTDAVSTTITKQSDLTTTTTKELKDKLRVQTSKDVTLVDNNITHHTKKPSKTNMKMKENLKTKSRQKYETHERKKYDMSNEKRPGTNETSEYEEMTVNQLLHRVTMEGPQPANRKKTDLKTKILNQKNMTLTPNDKLLSNRLLDEDLIYFEQNDISDLNCNRITATESVQKLKETLINTPSRQNSDTRTAKEKNETKEKEKREVTFKSESISIGCNNTIEKSSLSSKEQKSPKVLKSPKVYNRFVDSSTENRPWDSDLRDSVKNNIILLISKKKTPGTKSVDKCHNREKDKEHKSTCTVQGGIKVKPFSELCNPAAPHDNHQELNTKRIESNSNSPRIIQNLENAVAIIENPKSLRHQQETMSENSTYGIQQRQETGSYSQWGIEQNTPKTPQVQQRIEKASAPLRQESYNHIPYNMVQYPNLLKALHYRGVSYRDHLQSLHQQNTQINNTNNLGFINGQNFHGNTSQSFSFGVTPTKQIQQNPAQVSASPPWPQQLTPAVQQYLYDACFQKNLLNHQESFHERSNLINIPLQNTVNAQAIPTISGQSRRQSGDFNASAVSDLRHIRHNKNLVKNPFENVVYVNANKKTPLSNTLLSDKDPIIPKMCPPPEYASETNSFKQYSPPILPIPTVEKSLEMISLATQKKPAVPTSLVKEDILDVNKALFLWKATQVKHKRCPEKRKKPKMVQEVKRKISLEEYKKRERDTQELNMHEKRRRSSAEYLDLGYDSDSTMKL